MRLESTTARESRMRQKARYAQRGGSPPQGKPAFAHDSRLKPTPRSLETSFRASPKNVPAPLPAPGGA